MPLRHPAGAVGRAGAAQRHRTGGARVRDAVKRRLHAPGRERAAVHAAAGGAGAAAIQVAVAAACEVHAVQARHHHICWARLLERVLTATQREYRLVVAEACAFDIGMQHCPSGGSGQRRIIAANLARPVGKVPRMGWRCTGLLALTAPLPAFGRRRAWPARAGPASEWFTPATRASTRLSATPCSAIGQGEPVVPAPPQAAGFGEVLGPAGGRRSPWTPTVRASPRSPSGPYAEPATAAAGRPSGACHACLPFRPRCRRPSPCCGCA